MITREYTLITDVNTDVHPAYAKKEGILILPQYYYFEDGVIYGDETVLDEDTFYKRLAAGETAKSSGVNPDRARRTFEEELKKGKDILAIICSSGLSMSYNTCKNVAEELMADYPGSRIIVMDSLNESGKQCRQYKNNIFHSDQRLILPQGGISACAPCNPAQDHIPHVRNRHTYTVHNGNCFSVLLRSF